ncbi:MAG: NUDIX hydrolase [Verrucomicrobia bacterium]|nr:NUDIX hydrolase [Verrucomicrobiota bacterium]
MNRADAIALLDQQVPDPSSGLPDDVFYYISRTTPLINVDLLIKDEKGRTLLAWRDDEYSGTGWHVPGGIVRFKETLEARVRKVAETEIGAEVEFDPVPLAVTQSILRERRIRGHFVSVMYRCFLSGTFAPGNKGLSSNDAGFLMWHESCPANLVECHDVYRKYIQGTGG